MKSAFNFVNCNLVYSTSYAWIYRSNDYGIKFERREKLLTFFQCIYFNYLFSKRCYIYQKGILFRRKFITVQPTSDWKILMNKL